MIGRIQTMAQLIREGEWEHLVQSGKSHWRSEVKAHGLRRDLSTPFTAPDAQIPLSIRPIAPRDVPLLLEAGASELTAAGKAERAIRKRMIEANLSTCYVAVTENDEPTYMQWLLGPEENDRIAEIFGDRFPRLQSGEMLLEGAFTLEQWRGKKIMAAAMARIAELGAQHGARWVITFVTVDNVPSLKGCAKAGFEPYIERTGQWRQFRHKSTFASLQHASRPSGD